MANKTNPRGKLINSDRQYFKTEDFRNRLEQKATLIVPEFYRENNK